MKQIFARLVVVVSVMMMTTVAAFAQGVVWESKISPPQKGEEEKVIKTFYMPGKLRMEGDERNTVIVRLDQEKMYMLNMKEKTYQVMTFAEMEQHVKGANAQMEKLREQMKNMPEEQRKMMEKMMGGNMPGKPKVMKVDIERTGETKSINGYSCSKYVVKQDGKDVSTIWATKDVKEFSTMRKDLEGYAKRFASLNAMASKGLEDAMTKVDGFPMLVTTENGMTTTVTKIESHSTPDSAFEAPAGFTKVEMKAKMKEESKD